jgi:hypothetical protein
MSSSRNERQSISFRACTILEIIRYSTRARVQQRTRLSPRRGKAMATHFGYQLFAPLPVQRICPMTSCPLFCRWHVTQGSTRVSPLKTFSAMPCGHDWTTVGVKVWLFYSRLLHAAPFGQREQAKKGEEDERRTKQTIGKGPHTPLEQIRPPSLRQGDA